MIPRQHHEETEEEVDISPTVAIERGTLVHATNLARDRDLHLEQERTAVTGGKLHEQNPNSSVSLSAHESLNRGGRSDLPVLIGVKNVRIVR